MDVRKINDDAMEWLILISRFVSTVFPFGGVAFVLAAVWAPPSDWAAFFSAAGMLLGMAALAGWLGWYRLGNEDWSDAVGRLAGTPCGAHYRGMTCNVQVDNEGRHEGPHKDGIRDPLGVKTWN